MSISVCVRMLKKELFQVIEAFQTVLFDPLPTKMTSILTIERQSAYVNEKENEKRLFF